MTLSKANLETLIDIVGLLMKQGQMGRVHRGGRGPVEPGMGAGKPRGMPPPATSGGREWKDYTPTNKKEPESTPEPKPEPKPEPVKLVRTTDRYGNASYNRPTPETITPKGYHPSGRKKGFGRGWQ